jgi:fucose 4-O-acetylase-like acetyltransferase
MTGVRLAYPDAFKLIAIIGVIFAHLPPGRFDAGAWHMVDRLQDVLGWCVLGFFGVAGVLFRGVGGRTVREELTHRARRLLVPWLAFSVFYKLAVTLLAGVGVVQRASLPPGEAAGFLRWLATPADPQLYFLLYLFVIQALFLLISKLGERAVLVAGIAALAVWLASLPADGMRMTALHGAWWSLVPLYFACFGIGVWAGRSATRLAGVIVVFAAAAAWVVMAKNCTAGIAWQLAAPWLLLLLMQLANSRGPVKVMAWLGRFSGGVYVWHAPLVLGGVSIIAVKAFGGGMLAVMVTVTVSFAVAAAMGTLVNRARLLKYFRI